MDPMDVALQLPEIQWGIYGTFNGSSFWAVDTTMILVSVGERPVASFSNPAIAHAWRKENLGSIVKWEVKPLPESFRKGMNRAEVAALKD